MNVLIQMIGSPVKIDINRVKLIDILIQLLWKWWRQQARISDIWTGVKYNSFLVARRYLPTSGRKLSFSLRRLFKQLYEMAPDCCIVTAVKWFLWQFVFFLIFISHAQHAHPTIQFGRSAMYPLCSNIVKTVPSKENIKPADLASNLLHIRVSVWIHILIAFAAQKKEQALIGEQYRRRDIFWIWWIRRSN